MNVVMAGMPSLSLAIDRGTVMTIMEWAFVVLSLVVVTQLDSWQSGIVGSFGTHIFVQDGINVLYHSILCLSNPLFQLQQIIKGGVCIKVRVLFNFLILIPSLDLIPHITCLRYVF